MTTTFNLWMSRLVYDTFALVINLINEAWVPCYIIIGLFEAFNIFGGIFAKQVKVMLVEFNLTNKVIVYVKDDFEFYHNCLHFYCVGCFCFGHVISKTCQYVTNEVKVNVGMKKIGLKDAH
jgi:hypothetical protein